MGLASGRLSAGVPPSDPVSARVPSIGSVERTSTGLCP
jgi:hypothetical protein